MMVAQARVCLTHAATAKAENRSAKTPKVSSKKSNGPTTPFRAAKVAGGIFVSQTAAAQAALALDREQVGSFAGSFKEAAEAVVGVLPQGGTIEENLSEEVGALASPVVEKTAPVASKAAAEVTKAVTPVLKEGFSSASKVVEGEIGVAAKAAKSGIDASGVDVKPLVDASSKVGGVAKEAIDVAQPFVLNVVDTVTKATSNIDPAVLSAATGLGVLALVTSPLWASSAARSLRGYAGDISPVKAFDAVTNGGAFIVDIRTSEAWERSGIPSLPRGASNRLILVEPEFVGDSTLRARLSNVENVENQSTSLVIASLKKLNKNAEIILMGPKAEQVANALSPRGFKSVYVMEGGFDRRRGWVESGLPTEDGPMRSQKPVTGTLLPFTE